MSGPPPQGVPVTCPNCRTPFRAQVFRLIDVGRQPQLKLPFIDGQVNVASCPNCGMPIQLAVPLAYHDPAKQLFLVFLPQQFNLRPEEQEGFIGEATRVIMRELPPNAPRGYLLAPRRFLTFNSLVDTILEADGMSRQDIEAWWEMREVQRKRVELIRLLAEADQRGEEQLAALVEQHKDALDYEFFATLSMIVEASAQSGRDDSSQMFAELRDKLIELSGFDTSQIEGADDEDIDLNEVITRLSEASDEELEQAIDEVRPAIDYSFFEAWTRQIDAAAQAGDTATAERLTARRAQILETVERMDKQALELFEIGTAILKEVLAASDPVEVLRAHPEEIEDFLRFLEANIDAAQHAGNTAAAERLTEIQRLAIEIAQESFSPEERFINEMLQAETPQAATKLLRQNPAMITPAFVKQLNELAEDFERDGRKPFAERLRQLGREAGAMLF